MRLVCFFILLWVIFTRSAYAEQNIVNIYNWSSYISNDALKEFTQETGIKVNYATYDSNETLYAKLKANPHTGYDVIVPSTYFIDRMRQQGMLQALDKSRLPNFKNLNPALLNKSYDPGNHYSIPYFWSTTGIVVNSKSHPAQQLQAWIDFWNPRYRNQLLLLDDVHEVFSMALMVLGYSPNDTNPEHIRLAYLKLKELMPNVRLFNNDGVKSLFIDEDLSVGMAWNGDIYQAAQENPALRFIYPKEGFVISIDSMAIPIGASHVNNAYTFINFILRPDIAKKISLATGFATPNLTAYKLMPKAILNNSMIYPDKKTLQRSVVQVDVGAAESIYQHYWELLKIGG
ncbi:spermidine/putrescine ABC transporter substrate-binding protein [Candidatus Rickettsiella isopodorum]|jgi:spermidine/putrescine transport system substrate-binding protein|uniref:Putrescine-binding periplasmic protein n=1 Tax=Candidatus Rickettsiella isopodorum TaxID=1225476 RepID=A0A1J8PC97_9COXI|nr:spermidine/putrescine ABC transporter substrate-binding protein [Candidatus Rickettsiella isopodorum]OIZ94975.1 spermidine/putrescine ABC transporter substrate-binding protein [Candidatus Rickettsiella isopodorum]